MHTGMYLHNSRCKHCLSQWGVKSQATVRCTKHRDQSTSQHKLNKTNTYSSIWYINSVEILGFLFLLLFLPWITQSLIKKNTMLCTGQAGCCELTQAFSFLFWVPLWASQIQVFSLASKLGLFLPKTTSHPEKPLLSKRAPMPRVSPARARLQDFSRG